MTPSKWQWTSTTKRALAAALALIPIGIAACQAVGGIQSYNADPILGGCALPAAGDAQLRIANMAPGSPAIDICVRTTGGSFFRPVIREAGTACPAGVPYESVTGKFGSSAGSIDVKVIPFGSTCSATALAEHDGTTVVKGSTTTVLYAGGVGVTPVVSLLTEGPVAAASDSIELRVIDAIEGPPNIFLGGATSAVLPATLTSLITKTPIPFGSAAPAQSTVAGPVDANGYLATTGTVALTYGAFLTGGTNALLAVTPPSKTDDFTIYAAGATTSTEYPVRGILCTDSDPVDATPPSNGLFVACKASNPPSVTVGTFNTALYGSAATDWVQRHDPELQAIAANADNFDVLCLEEIGSQADQQELIAEALDAGTFPYSAVANTTLDTPFTDPTDQNGMTPPAPTQGPCASTLTQETSVFNCLNTYCLDPDAGALVLSDPNCASEHCVAPLAGLLGSTAGGTCFDCIIAGEVSYLPFTHVQNECATELEQPEAFDGQTPTMLLSRFPLSNISTYVLPSFMFRRTFIRAEMQVDAKTTIDVYCGQLTFIQGSVTPYEGNYGNGGQNDPSGGWANEQFLQAQRAVAFIQKNSSGRPAIIAGEFASSSQYPVDADEDAGTVVVGAANPESINLFQSAFVESIAPGYTPACTACPAPVNPFIGGTVGSWSNRIFTYNFPKGETLSSGVLGANPPIALNQSVIPSPAGMGATIPYSDSFAYKVLLLRP